MKKDEVPQDDDNGNYGPVGCVGWAPENTVLNQDWGPHDNSDRSGTCPDPLDIHFQSIDKNTCGLVSELRAQLLAGAMPNT